ncbi:MAG: EamA family transporter [Chloroflexi bacterium]|nr:EamA family transporter [Chloroflexota bacterium]MBI4315805.1 EamA family transporter [Chloroflexota bacterium]
MKHPRLTAALGVLFVTLIWSISTLLFKTSLRTVPPLTFAAAQVALAAVVLGALALARGELRGQWSGPTVLPRSAWARLAVMGIARYALGQATFILALAHLPASSATFVFSLNNLAILLMGIAFLQEVPSLRQWGGGLLAIGGAYLFFAARPAAGEGLGIAFGLVNVFAFSGYNILARGIGRQGRVSNLLVTAVSLACGAPILLLVAWLVEGPPHPAVFSGVALFALVWGGLLDTGLSLSLWNRALRVLWPFEVTVLARAQMIEVPILAGWFLGDTLLTGEWLGIGVTLAGIVLSQRWGSAGRGNGSAPALPRPGE